MSLTYKKTPPPRLTVVQSGNGMLGGGKPPPPDLPDEDNYEIQVWESKGGKFLGYALRTSLRLAVHTCWLEAIKLYPGKYLCQTNGPFEIRDVVAPAETPSGEIETDNEIRLCELPQWYGLKGQCKCGKKSEIDRYHPKVQKWKGYRAKPRERCVDFEEPRGATNRSRTPFFVARISGTRANIA